MKLWFRLTLTLVAWALLCLLLGLYPPVDLNHPLQVAGSEPWFDQGREAASGSPTASVVRNMEFDSARAGPLASVVLDCARTASHLGPPGQENHGPPGTDRPMASCRSSRQPKPAPSSNLLHEITGL